MLKVIAMVFVSIVAFFMYICSEQFFIRERQLKHIGSGVRDEQG